MAIAIDQLSIGTNSGIISATTIVLTTSAAVAANGFIVLCIGDYSAPATPVTSVAGGSLSWTIDLQGRGAASSRGVAIASAQAPSGLASSTAITVTYNGSLDYRTVGGMSFTGVATSSPVDGTPLGPTDSAVAAWSTGNYAIAAGSVIVATCWNENTVTGNTPTSPSLENFEIVLGTDAMSASQYRIESSAGSYPVAGTWGAAQPSTNIAVAYKAAAGGAGPSYVLPVQNISPLTWRT